VLVLLSTNPTIVAQESLHLDQISASQQTIQGYSRMRVLKLIVMPLMMRQAHLLVRLEPTMPSPFVHPVTLFYLVSSHHMRMLEIDLIMTISEMPKHVFLLF
jgi:hypothetical protein